MFNAKYKEAIGAPSGRVLYGKFQQHFWVSGLPPGIAFKRPNCYGREALKEILKCTTIKFEVAGKDVTPPLQDYGERMNSQTPQDTEAPQTYDEESKNAEAEKDLEQMAQGGLDPGAGTSQEDHEEPPPLLVNFIPDHATKHKHFIVSNFRKTFHFFLEYGELPALPILQITFNR